MKRIVLLLTVFVSVAVAQTGPSQVDVAAKAWAQKLTEMDLDGFREALLADPESWPHLSFATAQREPVGEMIQLLRDELSQFAAETPDDATGIKKNTAVLVDTGNALRTPGGYTNLLLSDAMYELAIVRLGNAVVQSDIEDRDWNRLVKKFPDSLVPLALLAAMFEEEGLAREIQLPNGDRGRQFRYLWESTGGDFARTAFMAGIERSSTSTLLRTRSVENLVARLALSEKWVRVGLAGYIRFRELGGRVEDLPAAMAEVKPFLDLFGQEALQFESPEFGITVLYPSHLLSFLDLIPRGGVLERIALE